MGKLEQTSQSTTQNISGGRSFLTKRKKIFFFVILPLIILAIAGGVYWYVSAHKTTTKKDTTASSSSSSSQTEAQSQAVYAKAVATAKTGGVAAGQAILDSSLKATTDTKTQASIYSQKASLATSSTSASDQQAALDYAEQADALSPSAETADQVAAIARSLNKNDVAVEYWNKAIDRVKANTSLAPDDRDGSVTYYNLQISSLSK